MLVVDHERSEIGLQRRKSNGRLLHCCCICGRLDVWGSTWSYYGSVKDLDDGKAVPKFCSENCRQAGGDKASAVTAEQREKAKAAEWRDPEIVWREQTGLEKYWAAAAKQP